MVTGCSTSSRRTRRGLTCSCNSVGRSNRCAACGFADSAKPQAGGVSPMPNDFPRNGADALVRRLRDHGVRHVFGYPGGQMTPIYDALYREPSIRHFLARHEQAAAFMADGYARATGKPGVCLAVCGPGVFNAATPLATAFTDSVPVLLISGQIPTRGR